MGYSQGGGVALQLALRHPGLVDKLVVMSARNMSDAEVSSLSARTMVVVGDADAVRPEHALTLFTLRGGGDEDAAATGTLREVPAARLVILPGTSHLGDDLPAAPDLF